MNAKGAITSQRKTSGCTRNGWSTASSVLFEKERSERDNLIYYRGQTIYAARKGAYKVHYITQTSYVRDSKKIVHDQPLLFNLEEDPSEKYNIANEHPEIVKEIHKMVELHRSGIISVKDQLAEKISK